MHRFTDQVAIVTGGARGIGKGIAQRLLQEGATLVIWDVLKSTLEEAILELTPYGEVGGRRVDISNPSEVQQAVAAVEETYHRIDILVNCAGIVGPTACNLVDYGLDDFQRVLNVNLVGSFLTTKHVLPAMLSRDYGRILHITSIGGKEGNPGMIGYAASKSGVIGLIKAVGKEYAEKGITVNGIAPAVIATPMNQDTDPKMLAYMTSKIPMKRLGTIEEVTSLACWIVSPEASFNTGFVFDLSGGRATY